MAVGVLVFVDMVVIVIMFSVESSDNRDVHRDWDRNTMGERMVDAGPEKTPCSVHSDGTYRSSKAPSRRRESNVASFKSQSKASLL